MNNFILKFLASYGYNSMRDFVCSINPSQKYDLVPATVTISTITGALCTMMGVWPIVVLAMVLVIVLEMVTGLLASHHQKQQFESCKFSRFTIKLAVWFMLLVCCQLFALFCNRFDPHNLIFSIGAGFFDALTVMIMIWFVIEYFTSVLENFAIINDKPKPYYINSLKDMGCAAFDAIKGAIGGKGL